MNDKINNKQQDKTRVPRQARAQHKIELIFEAVLCLLEEEGMHAFNTNAVAARAGVNIGTLYQYFTDKQALLDALIARELHGMSELIFESVVDTSISEPEDKIIRIVHAVVGAYGGRSRVHRMLIGHAMTDFSGGKLAFLYTNLMAALQNEEGKNHHEARNNLSEAQAFVLVHSCAGVLRTFVLSENPPAQAEVETALVVLITSYLEQLRTKH
ncbi:TetR/AcrR family transcriptional regulator [Rahnella sp. BCC 1045]|uniref:TetR/AcrR family transcriptional regulator n=1 Tax=Rahnella sp. BCC 1045 TaxID=2816251 RepID=UPI001C25B048|nr:TetR/AcrR family transcriptional regulator [Rahnella sp. BCC 1045]MBU9818609.1 TetR/AcrR family transcriptional regulator [Rahnella sp. BCC 1045]